MAIISAAQASDHQVIPVPVVVLLTYIYTDKHTHMLQGNGEDRPLRCMDSAHISDDDRSSYHNPQSKRERDRQTDKEKILRGGLLAYMAA